MRIVKYILLQLRIAWRIIALRSNVDLWVFFIGAEALVLPVITARLLRKRTVIASAGSQVDVARIHKDVLASAASLLQNIAYCLADKIILYSENLIREPGLERYRHKISIARDLFVDFSRFNVERPLEERDNLVGYIGRLSQEKGILNFMKAIPEVIEAASEVTFLVGGDGQLRGQVEEYAGELSNKVRFEGWVPHDDLPDFLNRLRLLVIPSYTEAGPYIAFEAMACGTPVLGTHVGLMRDIIKDGETGFFMEDNSPECIAENIVRALDHPDLEQIARSARALVQREFTYDKAVETYRETLEDLLRSR